MADSAPATTAGPQTAAAHHRVAMRPASGQNAPALTKTPLLFRTLLPTVITLAAISLAPATCHSQKQLFRACKTNWKTGCVASPVKYQKALAMQAPSEVFYNTDTDHEHSCRFGVLHGHFSQGFVSVRMLDDGSILHCQIFKMNPENVVRSRRQASYRLRGRYRGQTQSQYLSIDRGNGKDEGKAEAHSAADSSRAIVSGNSGMGQAQSQTVYDPTCEDCNSRLNQDGGTSQRGSSQGYNGQGLDNSRTGQDYEDQGFPGKNHLSNYPQDRYSTHQQPGDNIYKQNGNYPSGTGLNDRGKTADSLTPQNIVTHGVTGNYPNGVGATNQQYPGNGNNKWTTGYPGGNAGSSNGNQLPPNNIYLGPQNGENTGGLPPNHDQITSGHRPGQGGAISGQEGAITGLGGTGPLQGGNLQGRGPLVGGQSVQGRGPLIQNGAQQGPAGGQPNQGGNYPNQGGYLPNQEGMIPGQGGIMPGHGGIIPGQGKIISGQGGAMPDQGGIIPTQSGTIPGRGEIIPGQGGIISGHRGNLPSQGGQGLQQSGVPNNQGGLTNTPSISGGSSIPGIIQGSLGWPILSNLLREKGVVCCFVPDSQRIASHGIQSQGVVPGSGGTYPGITGPIVDSTYQRFPPNNIVAPGQTGQESYQTHNGQYPGTGQTQNQYPVPSQTTGQYPGSGQITSQYPGTGQNTGQYPGSGQIPGQYPESGQNNGPYPGSGHNTGSYPGSGLNTGQYPGSAQNTGQYPGQTIAQYPGTGSNTGQHPGSGQTTGQYPGSGQNTGQYPGSGQTTGQYPGSGQTTGQYPGSGQTTGHYPVSGQTTGQYPVSGQTTGQYPGSGQTTGQYPGSGQTTGQYPGSGQTTGQYPGSGQTTGQYPGSGQTTGQYPGSGQTTGQYPGSGQTTGQYPGTGQTTGQYPGSGQTTGQYPGSGQTTGQYPGSGQTTGQYPGSGQTTGQYPASGQTTGQYPGSGQTTGQYPGTGQTTGQYPGSGQATGQYPGTGQTTGQYPGSGQTTGQYPGSGQTTGQYPGSGQTTVQYPGSGQTPGQYPGSGQTTGQYPGSGQTTGQYPGSGQTTGPYPGSGQNTGQYPGSGQPTGQYPGSGQTTGQYPGTGQTTGQYPGSGQTTGQYPGSGQTTGQYPGSGPNTGQYPGTGQTTGQYPGSGQTIGQYPGTGQSTGQYSGSGSTPGQNQGSGLNGQQGPQKFDKQGNPVYNYEYTGEPQNVVDPNSIKSTLDDYDSQAQASVSQAVNGTTALASSKGGNEKGRAQTQVEGTYTGTGSFSANAEISDDNKAAQSHVSGSKKGASSSAEGRGRKNKSQASVKLGSETGSILTDSQSSGDMHSSSSQVQGSVKGGMADAQAKGPGSTSSQAQIGFTPFKEEDKERHDLLKTPFEGGGTASAQSSKRMGTSQSQLRGTFKYGISYNGAAQAGSSLDKDAVFSNLLPFDKIDVYDENNKNINVDISTNEKPKEETISVTEDYDESTQKSDDQNYDNNERELIEHAHSDHHKTAQPNITTRPPPVDIPAVVTPPVDIPPVSYPPSAIQPTGSPPAGNRRSFHNNNYGSTTTNGADYDYQTDKDLNEEYDIDLGYGAEGADNTPVDQGEYANYDDIARDTETTHQSLQNPNKKSYEIRQTTGGNTQHIILGSLKNHDAKIIQKNSELPDEKRVYQPGEKVPGMGGYTIPVGFTGSVKSVASKENTYVVGSKYSPSQAQTVKLTPGTGEVKYVYPNNYGQNINRKDLRSLRNSKSDDNRYVSVSKSVTRDLDSENNIRKQYSHTYYTKSSSCGYFTFTCTMVSSAEGKKKVCKPKIPTNPDGTPMRC